MQCRACNGLVLQQGLPVPALVVQTVGRGCLFVCCVCKQTVFGSESKHPKSCMHRNCVQCHQSEEFRPCSCINMHACEARKARILRAAQLHDMQQLIGLNLLIQKPGLVSSLMHSSCNLLSDEWPGTNIPDIGRQPHNSCMHCYSGRFNRHLVTPRIESTTPSLSIVNRSLANRIVLDMFRNSSLLRLFAASAVCLTSAYDQAAGRRAPPCSGSPAVLSLDAVWADVRADCTSSEVRLRLN
jgi:hypothetical protein